MTVGLWDSVTGFFEDLGDFSVEKISLSVQGMHGMT